MKSYWKWLPALTAQGVLFGLALWVAPVQALDLSTAPMFINSSIPPQVMLDVSKDQQLYKKAYNDYSDLDGDGQLETSYKHSIDYYGYFDPYKCYSYSNDRFEPLADISASKKCSGQWSGNFLNWATMTRMDAVRKLLYGGLRSTDQTFAAGGTGAITVLERAYLPTDAHAFAKYYAADGGATIAEVTPFADPTLPSGTATAADSGYNSHNAGIGSGNRYFISSSISVCLGDQIKAYITGSPNSYVLGYVSEVRVSSTNYSSGNSQNCSTKFRITVDNNSTGVVGSGGSSTNWTVENRSGTGITLCNLTLGGGSPNDKSQTNTNPPLVRVASGNFALWGANERWQCYWKADSLSTNGSASFGSNRSNGNQASLSGLNASAFEPVQATHGLGTGSDTGEYKVRVKACVSGRLGSERCKQYTNGNYKPIGLLQYYGDGNQLHFGLMTGSYAKNISGGVLRKNVGAITDEINVNTDGTFIQPASPPNSPRTTSSTATPAGIINTLNYMRIYGYNYGDGTYGGSSGDNCTFQLTNITENSCTSWGNPMSEVYYESLRYFAGSGATSAYTYTNSGSKDNQLGLPLATWSDPLTTSNYCAPLNVLMFNASVSSYDDGLASTAMTGIGSELTVAALTNAVGSGEGLNGNSFFVGRNGSSNNELCDAKSVSNLGSISGICPEGPTLQGSWLMDGLAHHARTNRIRSITGVPADDNKSLKVTTYGVQLATNVPQIRIALAGESTPRVILQPAYRLNNSAPQGGGQLVDLKIVSQTATATTADGTAYLNWEDSEQGGDYDQDMWGLISWHLDKTANTITVTTRTMAESTNQPQGFGYIISGTTKDGPHFHSGIENFSYTDPSNISVSPSTRVNASGGCNNCTLTDAASTATYSLGSTTAGSLKDPLWYAAKWGGFTETTGANNLPDQAAEWDSRTSNGQYGSDGVPDNYFLVSNPLGLDQALDRTFTAILETAAASAVTTNSTSIRSDSRLYQARFNSNGWSGQLLAYTVSGTGTVSASSEWDAAVLLRGMVSSGDDTRTLITYGASSRTGVPFTWSGLTGQTAQLDALNHSSTGALDNRGSDRVGWLRGQTQHEGKSASQLRQRTSGPLGDIVNSNPMYVGPPAAGYSDVDYDGYSSFASTWRNRTPIVWVGGNDGMLHGFNVKVGNANVGKEVLGYVPSTVYANLSHLTAQGYAHKYYVDGSPMVADAVVGNAWKTVLVGGQGNGGKGYFALDVTDPDTNFLQNRAASLVLWEFTAGDDADLGYTYNLPAKNLGNAQSRQIVRMNDGRWAAIVGNGYNSTAGKAALFVLFLNGGGDGSWSDSSDYVKLVAESATGSNGLSTPVPHDRNGDGKVDVIYAGDLKGHLWKFDVSSSDPAQWQVALSGLPLFSAVDASGNAQPIIAPPEVTPHKLGGTMILFGTGKYLEASDETSTAVQTFYGIWDRAGANGTTGVIAGEAIPGRQWLQDQTYTEYTDIANDQVEGQHISVGVRVPDGSPVVWCNANNLNTCLNLATPTAYLGWRMDLTSSGERMTGIPQLINGVIYFSTFIPSDAACLRGGDGWLMALDYANGTVLAYPAFDTNSDGVLNYSGNVHDVRSGGIKTGAALGGATFLRVAGKTSLGVALLNRLTGDVLSIASNMGSGSSGRVTWHELVE